MLVGVDIDGVIRAPLVIKVAPHADPRSRRVGHVAGNGEETCRIDAIDPVVSAAELGVKVGVQLASMAVPGAQHSGIAVDFGGWTAPRPDDSTERATAVGVQRQSGATC